MGVPGSTRVRISFCSLVVVGVEIDTVFPLQVMMLPLCFQEIGHNSVKPSALIPLSPMSTLVEDVELSIWNQLEKWNSSLYCSSTIIVPPQDQGLYLKVT